MKNIQECLGEVRSITEFVNTTYGTPVNEGLKEWFKKIKGMFKDVYEYLKGVVVKLGTYFIPVDDNGGVLPAITPMTAGAAYKNGDINTESTFVYLDKQASKIAKFNSKYEDALEMYGDVSPIDYWASLISESGENPEFATILENYMENFDKEHPELVKESKGFMYIKSETLNINEVKLQNDDPEAKYNVVVDNNELRAEIKMHIRSKALAPLLIWGAPGIGKTAVLRGVLKEMEKDFPNYNLIIKTLSNETHDNFTLPTYVETPDGRKADDIPKTWLPVYKPTGDKAKDKILDEKCGCGLLFIDELSRATPQVLSVILPLINDRIFNGYNLGSGWAMVVASNRKNDETDNSQSNIGNALGNRFAQIYYEPTVHTWREWADKQGFISPLLLQWLSLPESENMSGAKYYYMDPNEGNEGYDETKIMCTPRSWTNAMRSLAVYQNTLMGKTDGSEADLSGFNICNIPTRIIQRQLNKCVPAQAVDAFVAFLDVISKIGDFDRAVDAVWNKGTGFTINKKDLNKITLPVAQLICTSHSQTLPTAKEFENLAKWLVAQDSDQLASYVLDIFKSSFINIKGIQMSKDNTDAFFIANLRIKRLQETGKTNEAKLIMNMYKPVCDAWGISIDEIPNYYPGLQHIAKKYGESFKSAVVGDWTDALG